MIFDFYFETDFKNGTIKSRIAFKDLAQYKDIHGNEVSSHFDNAYATSLYRENYDNSYALNSGLHLWLFGYAFTSKEYSKKTGRRVNRIHAKELLNLSKEYELEFVHLIKGSFVLVFYDENENTVKVITDKLNVLPLYYSLKESKLAISSNTSILLTLEWVNREPDDLALAMQSLFDYMLGEYYFIKGIRRFENGIVYSFRSDGLEREHYFDVKELYHQSLPPKKNSLDLLAEQLKENVALYSAQSQKVLVALTGGFDGRTNLAMLDLPQEQFKCYSYGMPGSKQIGVPQEVARKTGIDYEPIYLEQDFLDQYYENSVRAAYFSNGTAPIGFCNIPYAYRKLRSYSQSIITGLFGSEILRPLHNVGIMVNDNSFELFLRIDYRKVSEELIKHLVSKGMMNEEKANSVMTELIEYLEQNFFEKYKDYDKESRFFFFIIQEGIRKYFSQEILMERVYVTTYFPYFDFDLIDLIYQTPWAGMYNGFLGNSKFKRRKGQLLYAHIIKKYKPELGKIKLDRGYRSNDLLLPFPINYARIALGVYQAKSYMHKVGGNDTFKTPEWSRNTISQVLNGNTDILKSFNNYLRNSYKPQLDDGEFLTYRHFVSLSLFLQLSEHE